MEGAQIEFSIAGGLEAARDARWGLLNELPDELPESVRDDILLILSELVTNAVRHVGIGPEDTLTVRAKTLPEALRIEVVDPEPAFRWDPDDPADSETERRGLLVVRRLCSAWGSNQHERNKTVWVEYPL